MTDNFYQKFEEKVMTLLAEVESSRKELNNLRQEISNLKADKINYTKKLQGLVSLFDSLSIEPNNESAGMAMHGQEDFAAV